MASARSEKLITKWVPLVCLACLVAVSCLSGREDVGTDEAAEPSPQALSAVSGLAEVADDVWELSELGSTSTCTQPYGIFRITAVKTDAKQVYFQLEHASGLSANTPGKHSASAVIVKDGGAPVRCDRRRHRSNCNDHPPERSGW